jgi:hypothetical protein
MSRGDNACRFQELRMERRLGKVAGDRIPLLAKNSTQGDAGKARVVTEGLVSRVSRLVPGAIGGVIGTMVVLAGVSAQAQNLDAGKSPERIFSDTCNACHRSPRELKQTSPAFMREHYTTNAREAATMAAYLSTIGSDARAVQQRKPPALGAGRDAAPPDTPPMRPPQGVPAGTAAASPDQAKPGDQAKPADQGKPADQAKPPETQAALPNATPSRRTPPTPPPGEQAKPAPAPATARPPRRPSESIEAGRLLPAAGGAETPAQTLAAPAVRPSPGEEFEE